LYVQGPPGLSSTENQTARPVFVVRVILDQFSMLDRIADLSDADAPQDGLIERVARELEFVPCELLPYFINQGYGPKSVSTIRLPVPH